MFPSPPPATRALILINIAVSLLQQLLPNLMSGRFARWAPHTGLFPPVPAWLLVTGYALLELLFGVTGAQPGVAHFAHLGGMLGGALCILYWRSRRGLTW